MNAVLDGLDGFTCLMDDVLVFGKDQAEYDQHLNKGLERIQSVGASSKCVFSQTELKFLGHLISKDGVNPDPDRLGPSEKLRFLSLCQI